MLRLSRARNFIGSVHPSIFIAGAIVAVLSFSSYAELNFPVGTYVYKGSVMNYRHELCSSGDDLTVQAVTTGGVVLASCRVTDPAVSSGINYRLEVPVSSRMSSKSAAVGDSLVCVVKSDSGQTSVSAVPMPGVAAANAITNMNIVSAPSTAFPSGNGSGGTLLVSDDYLAGIAPFMEAYGKTVYEPSADWDGDGISNYSEYLAGTNPFDGSDRLRITKFAHGGDAALLKFEYAGGHLYAVDASPVLTNLTWTAAPFKVESKTAPEQKTVYMPGTEYEDIGEVTIYLTPAADSPSMFYTVRPE